MPSDWVKELRNNVKFLVKLRKSGSEIIEMLRQVYGTFDLKPATVCKWWKRFKEGSKEIDEGEP